jgi:hypothetical protein
LSLFNVVFLLETWLKKIYYKHDANCQCAEGKSMSGQQHLVAMTQYACYVMRKVIVPRHFNTMQLQCHFRCTNGSGRRTNSYYVLVHYYSHQLNEDRYIKEFIFSCLPSTMQQYQDFKNSVTALHVSAYSATIRRIKTETYTAF